MKTVKAVIFDMDGLLIDSERLGEELYLRFAPEYGIQMTREIYRRFIGTDLNFVRNTLDQEFPGADNGALIRQVEEAKQQARREGTIPAKKGVYELFDYLEAKGIQRIVATSTTRELATVVLEKRDLARRLNGGAFGDEVAASKPEPDIFLKALERAGTTPAEALILEDSPNGLIAANRAGIDVIMIPDLVPPPAERNTLAVLEDLTQVIDFLERERA